MKKIMYSIPKVKVEQIASTSVMNPGSVSTIEKGGKVSEMTGPKEVFWSHYPTNSKIAKPDTLALRYSLNPVSMRRDFCVSMPDDQIRSGILYDKNKRQTRRAAETCSKRCSNQHGFSYNGTLFQQELWRCLDSNWTNLGAWRATNSKNFKAQ